MDHFLTASAEEASSVTGRSQSFPLSALVHLDHAVNLIYKPEAGEEANGTCKEEEDEDHNHCVTKVEDSTGRSNNLQLRKEVMHSINKQIDRCEAAGQEGTPPPVVVLSTKMEIAEQNGGLGTGDE